MISTAISVAWYLLSIASGVPNAEAVKVSIEFLIVAVAIFTVWYSVVPRPSASSVHIDVSKRALLPKLAMAAIVLASIAIGTPVLEAAILDKRLRTLLEGDPTQDKIEEAAQIVSEANDKKLRASPQLISQLGQRLLQSSSKPHLQEAALTAACAFASYRSSLSPLPRTSAATAAIVGTIVFQCGGEPLVSDPPFVTGVPWVKGGPGGFACSKAVVYILEPLSSQAQLPLDGMYARNIAFVGGTYSYDGGSLKLKSIQFINSKIQVSVANASNQNVRLLISAILTGQPINLDI